MHYDRATMKMWSKILCALFLFPNNLFADVRMDEHHLSMAARRCEYASIPDPLSELAPIEGEEFPSFRMPADGIITSLFGWRKDPIEGRRKFHAGIDIANLKDSRIVAAESGVVAKAGRMAGCGLGVLLRHRGGMQTRYCHLKRINVAPGRAVSAGDTLGRMGATGRATGSHLHFELRVGGVPVDPARLLWLAFAPESG